VSTVFASFLETTKNLDTPFWLKPLEIAYKLVTFLLKM
jgi:hypothetical protein